MNRNGEAVVIEAPLPKDIQALGNQLDKWQRNG
jgi:hypothetical protein